jgi:uncharacterized membrane protein
MTAVLDLEERGKDGTKISGARRGEFMGLFDELESNLIDEMGEPWQIAESEDMPMENDDERKSSIADKVISFSLLALMGLFLVPILVLIFFASVFFLISSEFG